MAEGFIKTCWDNNDEENENEASADNSSDSDNEIQCFSSSENVFKRRRFASASPPVKGRIGVHARERGSFAHHTAPVSLIQGHARIEFQWTMVPVVPDFKLPF